MLRLFESNEVAAPQALPGGPGVPQPLPQQGHWDQDPVSESFLLDLLSQKKYFPFSLRM